MPATPRRPPPAWKAPLALALVTLGMLCALELRHPYFFFQDDNRGQNLPYYVHNLRALLGGEMPLFNFHQLLGTPVLACVQSAAFYPLNYLALGLSRIFLGHWFGAMEFIAAFHLTIAALGFRRLMRHFGLGEAAAAFGAVAWAFCGFVTTAGNSWIQVLGYAAYLPWILLFSLRQLRGFDLRGYAALAGLRTLDLFLGYPPFFAYTVVFDLLTVVTMRAIFGGGGRRVAAVPAATPAAAARVPAPWPNPTAFAAAYAGNYLLVAGLSAALLLPALHQVGRSADRAAVISWGAYAEFSHAAGDWLRGLLVPFASGGGDAWFDPRFISHVGYLTLLFAVVALAGLRGRASGRAVPGLALLAAVAFLWAGDLVVTRVFYQLPYFNRLRWPFKLTFFTSFYLIAVASFGCELLRARLRKLAPRAATGAAWAIGAAHVVNFLLLYLLLPQHMFSRHEDPVPLTEPLQETLAGGRVVSFGTPTPMEGGKRVYGHSVPELGFNYPTLFGLYGFGGYELLVSARTSEATFGLRERSVFVPPAGVRVLDFAELPLEYFRGWGVRWYVVGRRIPVRAPAPLVEAHRDGWRTVLLDPAARPLVSWAEGQPAAGLAYRFGTNVVEVETQRAAAGALLVNVLHDPFFEASVDGRRAPIVETTDGQMLVDLPAGRHRVVVRYADPYFLAGVLVSAATLALLLAVLRSGRVRSRGGAGG